MNEIFAGDFGGKRIVGTDGTVFGRLHTVTVDPESGALYDLVVEPRDRSAAAAGRSDDDDRLLIPVDRIETVKDQIVVRVGS